MKVDACSVSRLVSYTRLVSPSIWSETRAEACGGQDSTAY